MKKVSIIIPCYNKGKYIKEAVKSAINQTYQNIEIICIDDASTDDSYETLKSLVDKYKNIILLKNDKNMGVIYSRNTAIDASTGEYILPLDGDDTIEPIYVEEAVKILDKNRDIGVVYCNYKYFGKSCRKIKLPEISKEYLLYSSCISSCSMFRKKDFQDIGGYKECMKNGCEDWELWLTFYEKGYKFKLLDEYMLNYRKYKENSRTDNSANNIYNVKKQIIKNHIDLYLEDNNFIDKIFVTGNTQKKYLKYKKLYNFFLIILIIMLIILILHIFII